MTTAVITPYLSPKLILLALDWKDVADAEVFLGFAIRRTPGFLPKQGVDPAASCWLPNRIGFSGPNASVEDMPSNTNPIRHFQWRDAHIYTEDRGTDFTYEVSPVKGPYTAPQYVEEARGDPTVGQTAQGAAWSESVLIGDASVRVFFVPEQPAASKTQAGSRLSIDAVVEAMKNATSSVMFSLLSAWGHFYGLKEVSLFEKGLFSNFKINLMRKPFQPYADLAF